MTDRPTLIVYDEDGNRIDEKPLINLMTATDEELEQLELLVLGERARRRDVTIGEHLDELRFVQRP